MRNVECEARESVELVLVELVLVDEAMAVNGNEVGGEVKEGYYPDPLGHLSRIFSSQQHSQKLC